MTDKSASVSKPRDLKMIVERDVKIPMRDGSFLYADIFRPDGGAERFPCIMSLGRTRRISTGKPRTTWKKNRTST